MAQDSFLPASHSLLVVDDTPANRRLYGTLLEKAGFTIRTAEDGAEALELIEQQIPSLVLLDYMMPRMDGIEVLERLRASAKTENLPVVMLTASAEPDHIDRALEAGANDYITKPVNGKLLIARVKSMIRADTSRESSASRSALLAELDEAAKVQQAQLPSVPFAQAGWHISGTVLPSGKVGGDIFDIVTTDDDRIVVTLLDVSGHGTASALIAAEMRAELRNLLEGRSLEKAIERLNQHMARRETGKFSCLAAIELRGGRFNVLNAGLPPVLLMRGAEIVAEIWGSGLPIGVFDNETYSVTELEAKVGDRILVLSDGLTEPFGRADDSLGAAVRLALRTTEQTTLPKPEELRDRIMKSSLVGATEDDRTVVVIERGQARAETLVLTAHPEAVARGVRWAKELSPGWIDPPALDMGLTEALTNAIIHGALGLESTGRAQGGYLDYLSQAANLPLDPEYMNRQVTMQVTQTPGLFEIHLTWENTPCPPEEREISRDPPSGNRLSSFELSGMGSNIIATLFDLVTWDDDGLGMVLRFEKHRELPV